MVLLLALDTATSAVTAALHDGDAVLASRVVLDVRGHAELLAPAVSAVLAEAGRRPADVTHVVAGTGPGPFTGLRVGLVTAATFAAAVGARLGGLCSLDAIAAEAVARHGLTDGEPFVVASDARRKEVYWATYAAGDVPARSAGPEVSRPADVPADVCALPAYGRGPLLYPDAFAARSDGPLDVDGAALARLAAARLAGGAGLDDATPLYLRRPDAQPSAGPRRVTPLTPVPGAARRGTDTRPEGA